LLLVALTSCDFEVTNPGPIQDPNVDDPGAHAALVNGVMRGALQGLSSYATPGGSVARDFQVSGSSVQEGIELGLLHELQTAQGGWNSSHQGRWIGEHMAGRIESSMGAAAGSYAPLARFYLWAGLASRTLGENACTAVFEGGGPEPYLNYFTRAVEQFKKAEQIASAVRDEPARLAAIAFRASAYLHLGKWDEAAADAAKVPVTFSFQAPYNARDGYGMIGSSGPLNRSVSFWSTVFEEYFPRTGDPRVAWGYDASQKALFHRPTWGIVVPLQYPLKWYAPRGSSELTKYAPVQAQQDLIPVDLTDGREMLLIRAEVLLKKNDVPGAMALLNQVRTTAFDSGTKKTGNYYTGAPLAPATASNATEAWTALKFERLVELNMEGRRFGDRKRWAVDKTPGALDPREYLPDFFVQKYGIRKQPSALCFPMHKEEKDVNRNVPLGFQDTLISEAP